MLSESLAKILSNGRCLTADELATVLTLQRSEHGTTRQSVITTLISLSTFEQCWRTGEAWSLAGQCPHRPRDASDDPEPVLESLPSMFAWQIEALVAWHEAGSRGMIEAVTGAGKSMIALHAIHETVSSGGHALVVVPTIELQAQWLVLLQSAFARRFTVEKLLDRMARIYTEPHVVVAVINSARDSSFAVTGTGNLLVVDEVHRCASPVNARVLDNRFDYRLGLSATIARPDGGHHRYLEPYFGSIVYRYLYAEAVRDNVIARFRLTLHAVTMYQDEWDEYLELGRLIKILHRAFLSKYDLPIPGSEFVAILVKACAGHFNTRSPGLQEIAIKLQQAL
ncbi:MAG: DEAD/DEAH box helicase family protein, partial [Actinobacteria bacterium]|nr:DEAD/DEAH box helicase family protein [Actinomycetota bacterium]